MALKPKTGSLRIRIDPDLLELFRVLCERRGMTVSEGVRRFMEDKVGLAYKPQDDGEATAVTSPLPAAEKLAVEAVVKPEGVLARKRRLEKEAKLLRSKKKANRHL